MLCVVADAVLVRGSCNSICWKREEIKSSCRHFALSTINFNDIPRNGGELVSIKVYEFIECLDGPILAVLTRLTNRFHGHEWNEACFSRVYMWMMLNFRILRLRLFLSLSLLLRFFPPPPTSTLLRYKFLVTIFNIFSPFILLPPSPSTLCFSSFVVSVPNRSSSAPK